MKYKREIIIVLIGFTIGFLITSIIKYHNQNISKNKIILKQQIELDSLKTKLDFCNGINY
jgi:uncharacterized membrane-anchored protein YhcB (DUF1043 family)